MGDGSDGGRLWIGGLPERVSEDDIHSEFDQFGKITSISIRYSTGKCSFAFVEYADRADALQAMKTHDQAKLFGMPFIKVAWPGPSAKKGKGKGPGRSRSPPRRRSRSNRRSRTRSRSRRARSRSRSRRRSRSPPPRRSRSRRAKSRSRSRRRSRSPPPQGQGRRSRSTSRVPCRRSPSVARRRSPSPKARSGSPRKRSSSPKPRSASRHRSPSPARASPSPRKRSRSQKGRSQSPRGSKGNTTIVVENLPEDMDSRELKDIAEDFAKIGKVVSANVLGRRSGELEFTAAEDAAEAIKKLDGRRVKASTSTIQAERLKAYTKR